MHMWREGIHVPSANGDPIRFVQIFRSSSGPMKSLFPRGRVFIIAGEVT